ncbi:MAG: hypothetical protein ABI237_19545 [Ginsengibacter sp.]
MKMIFRYSLCFFLLSFLTKVSFAQDTTIITKVPKFKPPVVKTFLGVNLNGAQVTVDEANQLVGLPLKIVDDNNTAYNIDSYQFLYKQKSYVRNDETGEKEVSFTIKSDRFKATPLPKIWIDNIKGQLQTDEQLYFFDIVVKDKKGREFFAPEIKITIK